MSTVALVRQCSNSPFLRRTDLQGTRPGLGPLGRMTLVTIAAGRQAGFRRANVLLAAGRAYHDHRRSGRCYPGG
jgi:hypothetical protein